MKLRKLALSSCAALLACACSGGGSQGANQSSTANLGTAANVAAPPAAAQASPELLTRVVDCQASIDAVAGLFGAIAGTKSGAERDELMRTSDQRRQLAGALRTRAMALGGELGLAQTDVEARLAAARQRVHADSQTGDFATFAGRMGREADQCTRGLSEMM